MSATTNSYLDHIDEEKLREYREAKGMLQNHNCMRPIENYCDICDRFERAKRAL